MDSSNISVVKVGDILLATVSADMEDAEISALQEHILSRVQQYEPRGVVIDISTVKFLDSYFTRILTETVQMISLMGTRSVLAGMHPSVAIATTQLGLTIEGAMSALDVDRALVMLQNES